MKRDFKRIKSANVFYDAIFRFIKSLFDEAADQDDELSFNKGQIFYDVSTYAENDGWYKATM